MAKLEFENLKCDVTIICIRKDGAIDDLDEIKNEIQDGIESVIDGIVDIRNNVVDYEISDVVLIADGSDKQA